MTKNKTKYPNVGDLVQLIKERTSDNLKPIGFVARKQRNGYYYVIWFYRKIRIKEFHKSYLFEYLKVLTQ
jgi:hypothetical protein